MVRIEGFGEKRITEYPISLVLIELCLRDGWENLVKRWEKPELFIWADYFFDLKLQVARTLNNGFRLVSSHIGYIIGGQGLLQGINIKRPRGVLLSDHLEDDGSVERFWNLELLGITKSAREREDEQSVQEFQQTIHGKLMVMGLLAMEEPEFLIAVKF